jgi:beta-phosphoglucomutase-like phosphatase (HAD superfamily)
MPDLWSVIQALIAAGAGGGLIKLIDKWFDRAKVDEERQDQREDEYLKRIEARCTALEGARNDLDAALRQEREQRVAEHLTHLQEIAELRRLIENLGRENLARKQYTADLKSAVNQEPATIRARIKRRQRIPDPDGDESDMLDIQTSKEKLS